MIVSQSIYWRSSCGAGSDKGFFVVVKGIELTFRADEFISLTESLKEMVKNVFCLVNATALTVIHSVAVVVVVAIRFVLHDGIKSGHKTFHRTHNSTRMRGKSS